MKRHLFIRRLKDDRRGATIVEFAFILMPMCVLIMGVLDIAYQIYATAQLQGAVQAAGRRASLEGTTLSAVDTFVKNKLVSITTPDKITITATNLRNFSSRGKAEKMTTDVVPTLANNGGQASVGDCWVDEQQNGLYDTNMTGNSGIGGADVVVNYRVTMRFDRLTPVGGMIGFGDYVTVTRSSVLRTEPYAGVSDPPTACKTS